MAAKTYIPKLVYLLRAICIYISKYRLALDHHFTPEQKEKLQPILDACEDFLSVTTVVIND